MPLLEDLFKIRIKKGLYKKHESNKTHAPIAQLGNPVYKTCSCGVLLYPNNEEVRVGIYGRYSEWIQQMAEFRVYGYGITPFEVHIRNKKLEVMKAMGF